MVTFDLFLDKLLSAECGGEAQWGEEGEVLGPLGEGGGDGGSSDASDPKGLEDERKTGEEGWFPR